MTIPNSSPARRRIHSLLSVILAQYGEEIGYRVIIGQKPRNIHLPPPDLAWFNKNKPTWSFFILPSRQTIKRLFGRELVIENAILCLDAAAAIGLLNPKGLIEFLLSHSTKINHEKARALLNELQEMTYPSCAHFTGTVLANDEITPGHFSLHIQAPFAQQPSPGQFLQVLCDPAPHHASPKYRSAIYSERKLPTLRGLELCERRPFLRRPFSIASYKPVVGGINDTSTSDNWLESVIWTLAEFEIIYKRLPNGPGTQALAKCKAGHFLNVLGPLGKGFSFTPAPEVAILVAGGIGAPPMLFLAAELVRTGCDTKIFLGAATKDRIPFHVHGVNGDAVDEFRKIGLKPIISTDDGSAGKTGLVTGPLIEYLEHHTSSSVKLFGCGPRPLLAALNGIAERFRLPCEVLLEERMACGFGACISCVCAVKQPGREPHFTRICTDGPAFDVNKVMLHA